MFNQTLLSIEKFAAFLDGNLSQSEEQELSQLAENNYGLHQLLDASMVIDNTISSFKESDLQLPQEINSSDFKIPTLSPEEISPLVALSPEPVDVTFVAAAACADEDTTIFSDVNQDDNITIVNETDDNSFQLMSENDEIDNNDYF